jgi:hypothetical protein
MIAVGRKPIKSINEKYSEGDLVLIKNNFNFTLGEFNGIYIRPIKEIEGLPKTRHEIDLETKEKLKQAEIERLKSMDMDTKEYVSPEMELKIKYFPLFKKAFKKQFDEIGSDITLEQIIEMPDALEVFEDFIASSEEVNAVDFDDNDFDDDADY